MNIQQVELYIAHYSETVAFYKEVLELICLSETENTTSFQAGRSVLTLHQDEEHSYYYHFALNIPPNLFKSAKAWIGKRVPLSTEDGEDEVEFEEFNASALYFEDPAGNIVEYIARRGTTPSAEAEQFEPIHILEISEIGISTKNVKEMVKKIVSLGIPPRNNAPFHDEQYLNFMGEREDEQYIIVGPLGRRWIFSDKKGINAPIVIKTDRGTIRSF